MMTIGIVYILHGFDVKFGVAMAATVCVRSMLHFKTSSKEKDLSVCALGH